MRIDGLKFFAFSYYEKTGYSAKSVCHKTFPGWFHRAANPDSANWGCYHGTKDAPLPEDEATHDLRELSQNFLDRTYTRETTLVDKVNSRRNGAWKAKLYERYDGKSLRQLHSMGGNCYPPPPLPQHRLVSHRYAGEAAV